MSIRTSIRLAAFVPSLCAVTLLAACGSSGGGTPTTGGTTTNRNGGGSGATQPASSTSQPASGSSSGSDATCADLTADAASAALGKSTTVVAESATGLAGLSICDVTIADEVYPIQLAVDTNGGAALYSADDQVSGGTDLSGVGDKAFISSIGVEALSGGVDIKVTGPAGPVLSGNFATPTAIAKAMVAALK